MLKLIKDDNPNPFTYPNPNEIFNKTIAKKEGSFSMPKSDRNFNFAKFSSIH